jgi:hypothetical protein
MGGIANDVLAVHFLGVTIRERLCRPMVRARSVDKVDGYIGSAMAT